MYVCIYIYIYTHENLYSNYMEVSINGGTPIAGWFIRENPVKVDDDWGYPYFRTLGHLHI